MKRIGKIILKAVISLAFFSVLLSFVKGNELMAVFRDINWFYFVISFGVTIIMVAASCAKWKLILDLKDSSLRFGELLRIYFIGYFFSNILPSTVGGDVVRSYYAGNLLASQPYAAISVFVERFSGIFFLFLLVIFAPLCRIELYQNPYIYLPAIAGLCFALITVWVAFSRAPFAIPDKLAHMLFSLLRKITGNSESSWTGRVVLKLERLYLKIIEILKKLQKELSIASGAIKNDKIFLRKLIFWTLLFYGFTWINVYTAYRAFNVEVSFISICAIVPAIMLVAHIPVTLLGNLGYFESVFVFYFLLAGVGAPESLAMGLLLRLKMLSMGGIGFFVYLIYKQKHELRIKETALQ